MCRLQLRKPPWCVDTCSDTKQSLNESSDEKIRKYAQEKYAERSPTMGKYLQLRDGAGITRERESSYLLIHPIMNDQRQLAFLAWCIIKITQWNIE